MQILISLALSLLVYGFARAFMGFGIMVDFLHNDCHLVIYVVFFHLCPTCDASCNALGSCSFTSYQIKPFSLYMKESKSLISLASFILKAILLKVGM